MEPVYEDTNYNSLNLGPDEDRRGGSSNNDDEDNNDGNIVFSTPKRLSSSRNSPFSVELDFQEYKKKRRYNGE